MSEIVKYHNDFNKIKLPSFTEQEQNLLYGILLKIK
ncbi:replication initiation protein, partial [Campylobacter upsaliensis]|nr:replication initiation protein [Campylobacter upsaliensis]EAL3906772.1 RepB family plasmid replication initiator protein [Campylobacter upsaliensis]EAL3920364.1 RepB family plasmid replication initiator protein [Campylobacter upsaliensis]EAL3991411.1 RepB family plasmid replication initiator protein [Campylobacter upsaliensis]EDP6890814.1 RepB family plasmid replication initiator protein [Campylobacter upsaliensis]